MPFRTLLEIILPGMTTEQRLTAARAVLWTVVLLFIFRAEGFLDPLLSGYVLADDMDKRIQDVQTALESSISDVDRKVAKLQEDVAAARIETLEQRLFDTRKAQCSALSRDNDEAVRFYREKIQALLRRYEFATGTRYQLPSCEELGL